MYFHLPRSWRSLPAANLWSSRCSPLALTWVKFRTTSRKKANEYFMLISRWGAQNDWLYFYFSSFVDKCICSLRWFREFINLIISFSEVLPILHLCEILSNTKARWTLFADPYLQTPSANRVYKGKSTICRPSSLESMIKWYTVVWDAVNFKISYFAQSDTITKFVLKKFECNIFFLSCYQINTY